MARPRSLERGVPTDEQAGMTARASLFARRQRTWAEGPSPALRVGQITYMDMDRNSKWSGAPGDAKHVLSKFHGLNHAYPIWVHDPDFGNDLFIFQATPKSGDTLNYVWNGISHGVCRITRPETLEEIRESVQKFGGREGDLVGLELEELTLP